MTNVVVYGPLKILVNAKMAKPIPEIPIITPKYLFDCMMCLIHKKNRVIANEVNIPKINSDEPNDASAFVPNRYKNSSQITKNKIPKIIVDKPNENPFLSSVVSEASSSS